MDENGNRVNARYAEDCDDSEFVDKDGDDVCDLHGETPGDDYGQANGRQGRGTQQGYGPRQGRSRRLMDGSSYGDGDQATSHGRGRGMGRGRR